MKFEDIIACPICKGDLTKKTTNYNCKKCKKAYLIDNNTPIMLDKSFTTIPYPLPKPSLMYKIIDKITVSSMTFNTATNKNFRLIRKMLRNKKNPRILMVGGGMNKLGKGVTNLGEKIIKNSINLEISPGKEVDLVGDGHELPFKNNSFDAIVIQGVLEHVRDANKVVSEAKRVLKKQSYIYGEIPFIQQLHGIPHDYRRFTTIGIVELFSDFKKIKSGVTVGPTAAFLVISKEFIAISLSFNSNLIYNGIKGALGWVFFPFKYLDFIFAHYKNSRAIASGVYFLGEKE